MQYYTTPRVRHHVLRSIASLDEQKQKTRKPAILTDRDWSPPDRGYPCLPCALHRTLRSSGSRKNRWENQGPQVSSSSRLGRRWHPWSTGNIIIAGSPGRKAQAQAKSQVSSTAPVCRCRTSLSTLVCQISVAARMTGASKKDRTYSGCRPFHPFKSVISSIIFQQPLKIKPWL